MTQARTTLNMSSVALLGAALFLPKFQARVIWFFIFEFTSDFDILILAPSTLKLCSRALEKTYIGFLYVGDGVTYDTIRTIQQARK